ncbi:MAG: chemotaxis protein CheW [Desulfarculaceae bacterium]|nr:chemotaxis protein CheW [Desulfarculaceae bacterium]MCF8072815.1 chemotaxis protein CheW [Desulfarculaceae bacterium]MCF8100983.1 chemotaxis protein CheW [Desulfarculaceae bacterium]MCF8118547.1 chemotaxis protein CheW [Desulfarculaceae bacterium]
MSPESTAKLNASQQQMLERRARELARRIGREQEEVWDLAMVTFGQGRERYGVELPFLREVQPLKGLNWSPVPCTPPFIVGVVNLRGRLYSVMDLSSFLGAGTAEVGEHAHVLLVGGGRLPGGGQMELGLLSEDLPRIRRISRQNLREPRDTVSPEAEKYFQGVTKDMVALLEIDSLLSDPAIIVG